MRALAAVLLSSATVAAAQPVSLEAGVDANVHPGDDFFAYANGLWLRTSEIPPATDRWNARTEINTQTRDQIAKLFAEAGDAPPGSFASKLAAFRAAYADEAAIEAQGTTPLEPRLKQIDGIRDRASLTRMLGSSVRSDVDPLNWGIYDSAQLIGLAVQPGLHGEKTNLAFLLQGGLHLPSREHYVSTRPEMEVLRAKYRDHVGRMLELAGFDDATRRAAAVVALETALAQTHATPEASAEEGNVGNLWTRADLQREASGMDWAAFLEAAGLSRQEAFVVWQPSAVQGAAQLVASQPLESWRDYLRFHLIDRHADVLPRKFSDQAFAFRGRTLAGLDEQEPRSERALRTTQRTMSNALARTYVERHFPPEVKGRVNAITTNVIAALRDRISGIPWMSPASKARAVAKLNALYFGVGYPEQWPDESTLIVSPTDAIGNLQRVADLGYRNALARLGQPVDRREWQMAPHTVGAVLLFQQNAYNFPAALLQAPKFDPAASDAANYGAIGAIAGHEISHFVDTLGAQYDEAGRKASWWTTEDEARYAQAVEPLVRQFSAYRPFADAAVDGKLTLVENVADLGGLAAAFDAHRRALGSKIADRAYVRRQDREFFLGYARSWRGKMRDDALRTYLAKDGHAPERYRIATVRNIDAWYDAFDVRPGHALYLEPAARVRIW